jgi:hypothetical protein
LKEWQLLSNLAPIRIKQTQMLRKRRPVFKSITKKKPTAQSIIAGMRKHDRHASQRGRQQPSRPNNWLQSQKDTQLLQPNGNGGARQERTFRLLLSMMSRLLLGQAVAVVAF